MPGAEARADLPILCWDASAILSLLVEDEHSPRARRLFARPGRHLLSALAFAECTSVLRRLAIARQVPRGAAAAAVSSLLRSPWIAVRTEPDLHLLEELAGRHALRGADLWHLGLALTLHGRLSALRLLTFDQALDRAAEGEGFAAIG